MFGLDAGTLEQKKGSCWKHFLSNGEQSKKVAVTSRRSNVATSPCHDVRSTMQKSTIRNVVTFQRRDVSTSRRRNVATSQRRDVATSRRQHGICTSSFKARMVRNRGHGEAYERGHGIPEQSDANFEEVPGICTVSRFWKLE